MYLVFDEKIKNFTDPSKKAYEVNLVSGEIKDLNGKVCELKDTKLTCKISSLNDEAREYLNKLDRTLESIEEQSSSELPKKLKEKLSTIESEFKKHFGESLFENIKKELTMD